VLETQEGSRARPLCIVELKGVCTDFKSAEEGRNTSELAGRKPPLKIRDDQHTSKKACRQILVHVGLWFERPDALEIAQMKRGPENY